jgi:hypothetical protein
MLPRGAFVLVVEMFVFIRFARTLNRPKRRRLCWTQALRSLDGATFMPDEHRMNSVFFSTFRALSLFSIAK